MLAVAPARGFGRGRLPPCREPWPQPAAPCSWPGRGWTTLHRGWPWLTAPPPCCICCDNVAITRKTILRDSISSHEFKTNLSHKNLGSDTTIRKPQRVHHMRRSYIPIFQIRMEKMKEVKCPSP
ncbi:hypothetical protein B296_00055449 [Ensete ventricosum]|uniref:Uncharacterized protein n=1 Tax=Ensete ventricosum TaxID=4639 RepID=A0A426WWU3_ENSVE|nr:hypothetical protein B296_00055449 [Ensete ventricosum]